MAEQIERNGVRFYRKAAEIVAGKDLRTTLLELADMEADHVKIFEDIRKQISYKERELITFDPENEVALYLQAMASGHVFDLKKDMSAQLSGKETTEDILNMAVQAEKESIAFYFGLKRFVPAARGKEKVEDIIDEEMKHIVVLNDKLAALK
jgi:rubrerythrin